MGSKMAKITNDLLREAIADAERIRETAIANAKLQLEESITPTIKSEITKALMEVDEVDEAHDPHKGQQAHDFAEVGEAVESTDENVESVDEEETVDEIANDATSGIGSSDNKAPSPASSKSSGVGKGSQEWEKFHTGAEGAETPQQMKEEEEIDEDAEEVNEGFTEIEAIIRELQAEVEEMIGGGGDEFGDEEEDELDLDAEPEDEFGDEPEEAPVADDEPEAEFGDEEEDDLDIEEILREIEAELSEEEDTTVAEENARLKGELAEYRKAVELLRGKLNEVNLLNAKLLFTNKLFKGRELTQEQKVHVVETFDLATTIREVKLIYATLLNESAPALRKKTQPKMVTESIASNVVGSTAPKQEVIAEDTNDAFRRRMQQLAGVKVL